MLHFLPRLFLLVIFSGYDTKCALFEKVSMVNCSQEFLVPDPHYWCFAWLATSTISSAIVVSLVWIYRDRIKYNFRISVKKLIKKASFWRMNFFLSVILIEYTIAWKTSNKLHTTLYALSLARWYSTAVVIYCLNYVNPSRIVIEKKICYQIAYWLTLMMYFVECAGILLLHLLNSTLILPVVVNGVSGDYQALTLIVFGFKVAVSSQFLTFFLEKMFHGDKDLFSEPGDPVEIS